MSQYSTIYRDNRQSAFCLEEYALLLKALPDDPIGSDSSGGERNKTQKGHREQNPEGPYLRDMAYR